MNVAAASVLAALCGLLGDVPVDGWWAPEGWKRLGPEGMVGVGAASYSSLKNELENSMCQGEVEFSVSPTEFPSAGGAVDWCERLGRRGP